MASHLFNCNILRKLSSHLIGTTQNGILSKQNGTELPTDWGISVIICFSIFCSWAKWSGYGLAMHLWRLQTIAWLFNGQSNIVSATYVVYSSWIPCDEMCSIYTVVCCNESRDIVVLGWQGDTFWSKRRQQ